MSTYGQDVVAWSQEQAHWLRIGQFSALDIAMPASKPPRKPALKFSAFRPSVPGLPTTSSIRPGSPLILELEKGRDLHYYDLMVILKRILRCDPYRLLK